MRCVNKIIWLLFRRCSMNIWEHTNCKLIWFYQTTFCTSSAPLPTGRRHVLPSRDEPKFPSFFQLEIGHPTQFIDTTCSNKTKTIFSRSLHFIKCTTLYAVYACRYPVINYELSASTLRDVETCENVLVPDSSQRIIVYIIIFFLPNSNGHKNCFRSNTIIYSKIS